MLRQRDSEFPPLVMREITDPKELAQARAQRERADRNAAWLQAHAHEVYSQSRGKYLCIAGQELFLADTAVEARALGKAAHPEDDGCIVRYAPCRKSIPAGPIKIVSNE